MTVEATIIVDFSGASGTDYLFVVETDDILNEEKTSFSPGDTIHLNVNHTSNIQIDSVIATDGTVNTNGSTTRDKIVESVFVSKNEEELSEYSIDVASPSVQVSYLGRTGVLVKETDSIGRVKYIGDITKVPFLASFDITYPVKLFKVLSPNVTLVDDETYQLYIVFYISEV